MTPAFQARMDWREEGEFIPSRYPAGSEQQRQYLAEKSNIEAGEEINHEHSSVDIGQERHRQERIAAEFQAARGGIDSGGEKATAI